MKSKFIKYLPALIILTLVVASTTASIVVAKKITQPTEITSLEDLQEIHNNLGGYYVLSCDIDMLEDQSGSEKFSGWKPLGTKDNPFTGRIDFNYHMISNLYFCEDHLLQQFENVDDVLVGFLGYSTGTIIHANFYKPLLPDFSNYQNHDKNIIYGTACAYNDGYVTTCSVSVVGNTNTIKGNNITFGSLVGVNNKQVLIGKVLNTISADVCGDSIVGGVIGRSNPSSINSYLFRGGYNSFIFNGSNSFAFGGIIGVADGAKINNAYFGSLEKSGGKQSIIIGFKDIASNTIFVGGAIGRSLFTSLKSSMANVCVNNDISVNSSINSCFVGGMIGGGDANSITMSSCVFGGSISCADTSESGIFSQSSVINESSNSYYLSSCIYPYHCNLEHASEIDYLNLSLSNLGWPTNTERGYWTKESDYFYLNI